MQQRDLYIDFVKGLGALSIIFIHTTFWSGELYSPDIMRSLSLIFDVPIFFFLSGLTSSGNVEKTIYRLIRLQAFYCIFILCFFILIFVVNKQDATIEKLGNWLIHNYAPTEKFLGVMGSLWFFKVYFQVAFFGLLIIRYFKSKIYFFIIVFMTVLISFNFMSWGFPVDSNVVQVLFYLSVFLLAYKMKGIILTKQQIIYAFVFLFLCMGGVMYFYEFDIFLKMNNHWKFPPKIPYIVYSLISMVLVIVFYGRIKVNKNNLITYVGQNAIFFYFAQGISTSLLYQLVNPLKDHLSWQFLLMISFSVNALLTFVISWGLKNIDVFVQKRIEIEK